MKKNERAILFSTISVLILCSPSETRAQAFDPSREFNIPSDSWNFQNFKTIELSWQLYSDTFLGITEKKDKASLLDKEFYNNLYKTKLAAKGNCYGMSLMSLLILKKGGHLGFCAPASQYSGDLSSGKSGPTDDELEYAINRMHGHQVSLASLRHYLDLIAKHNNRKGLYAYDQVRHYKKANDPTLVSITKSLNPSDGAHTMVAYEANEEGGIKRIWVYDPSRPYMLKKTWYTSNQNYIRIGNSTDKNYWEFTKANGTKWSGDPGSGGNIIITPISIAGDVSRAPSSVGLENAGQFLNKFFIAGDGSALKQIENARGKRLFRPGTFEIDTNRETGMINVVPLYLSDQPADEMPAEEPYNWSCYFMFGDPGGALDLQIQSGAAGYELTVAGMRSHVQIQTSELQTQPDVPDLVTILDPGTDAPSVKLRNTIGVQNYDVQFTQIVRPGEEARVFKLTNLTTAVDELVELRVVRDQSALEVRSIEATTSFDLQLLRHTQEGDVMTDLTQVTIDTPGDFALTRPSDWTALEAGELQIDIQSIRVEPGR